jgi:hypothetical protein
MLRLRLLHLRAAQEPTFDIHDGGPDAAPPIPRNATGAAMQGPGSDHEARLRDAAARLFVTMRKDGTHYPLRHEVDGDRPVRHDRLTLDEVEKILETWKLRRPYGG